MTKEIPGQHKCCPGNHWNGFHQNYIIHIDVVLVFMFINKADCFVHLNQQNREQIIRHKGIIHIDNVVPLCADIVNQCRSIVGGHGVTQILASAKKSAAGVNRSTWFRNFSDKNEAITFKLIRLWHRWADEHGLKERRRYTLDNAQDFFAFNYSIKELLSEIYREELQACVYNAFYQVMMPQYGADSAECYEARFYSYGLFGFLDEWIKRGFYETPEQITQLFQKIMGSKETV